MEKKSKRLKAAAISAVGLFSLFCSAACIWSLCDGSEKKDSAWVKELSMLALSLISFFLAVFSFYVLQTQLHDGSVCTRRTVKKGAKEIGAVIASFAPKYVIYIAGNSGRLYEGYVRKYAGYGSTPIALNSQIRYAVCPQSPRILLTNKFYIDAAPLACLDPHDRVVIFDDLCKTGETIRALQDELILQCGVKKKNILTCGMIVDQYGYANCAQPAFYYKRVIVQDYYRFPWRQ